MRSVGCSTILARPSCRDHSVRVRDGVCATDHEGQILEKADSYSRQWRLPDQVGGVRNPPRFPAYIGVSIEFDCVPEPLRTGVGEESGKCKWGRLKDSEEDAATPPVLRSRVCVEPVMLLRAFW